jgi:hypothetical protein
MSHYTTALFLISMGLVACDPNPPSDESDRGIQLLPESAGLVPYG